MKADVEPEEIAKGPRRAALRVIGGWIFFPAFFRLTGGPTFWWEAAVYCAVMLVPMTIFAVYMARTDPAFLVRRMRAKEKEKVQRRLLLSGYPFLAGALVLPGLDHRYGWSRPPTWLVVTTLVVVVVAYLLVLRVFVENRWARRTVETSPDQELVTTGLYGIVRHPMYASSLLLLVLTPLALGSLWAMIPAVGFIPLFLLRIKNEEEVLVRELRGYSEYQARVRYRLVPFVW